jgi:glycosyltransferase involved in cell wall biosynthesis
VIEGGEHREIRFSLIMATLGRTRELEDFLVSLSRQSYRDFELIVVDQNLDDRLVPIIASYDNAFSITHLRSSKKGISRARNIGLKHARGEVVAFPDDDCCYPTDLLNQVDQFFTIYPRVEGLSGRSIDKYNKTSAGRFDCKPGFINRYNVWYRAISFGIFVRKQSIRGIWFDEEIGVGASTIWGAGEETDYLLQLLSRKSLVYYDPNTTIIHPSPIVRYDSKAEDRGYAYGCGTGRVLRKQCLPLWFVFYQWARPLGGALLALGQGQRARARYHWAVCRGRYTGWTSKTQQEGLSGDHNND